MVALELARATEDEKTSQLSRLADFIEKNRRQSDQALTDLQKTALSGGNIFGALMNTVRHCSLGQITQALYDVGGAYRRNM
jgi:methylmalonyl-CoA mutase